MENAVRFLSILFLFAALMMAAACSHEAENNSEAEADTAGNNNGDVVQAQQQNQDEGLLDDGSPLSDEDEEDRFQLDAEGDVRIEQEGEVTSLPPGDFEQKVDEGNAQLLDIRSSGAYQNERIPGAEHLDFTHISFLNQAKRMSKDQPVLVYCGNGRLSRSAAEMLASEGFASVYILEGGLDNWNAQNKATE